MSKTATKSSDPIQLTKAINSLMKTQDTFGKNLDALSTLITDQLGDIELRLANKQKALDELKEEYDRQLKNRKIEVDQAIKVYGYEEALKILADRKEVPVDAADYQELKAEVETLKQEMKEAVDSAVKKERERAERELSRELKTQMLENDAKQAEASAQLSQKQKEVEVLEKQIKSLQSDLEKQRELTRSVAEAARPQAPVYAPPPNQR
jgi:chromosome segregation ATPase